MSRSKRSIGPGQRERANKRGFRWSAVVSSLIMSLMVGCLSGDKKSGEIKLKTLGGDEAATFMVPRIDILPQPSDTMDGWEDIEVAKNYRFEACIQFRATQNKVQGHEFQVESQDGVIHKGQTDVNGCLRWSERFPFDFFAEHKYLQFERVIRGSGVVRGRQTIQFALDPWRATREGTHAEWEYLNQPNVSEQSLIRPNMIVTGHNEVKAFMNNGAPHDLLVDGLTMQMQQDRILAEGVETSMNLVMNPWVFLENINGRLVPYDLRSGKYTVYASIIGKNMRGMKVYKKGMKLGATERVRTYIVNKKSRGYFTTTNEETGEEIPAAFTHYLLKRKNMDASQQQVFDECSTKIQNNEVLVREEGSVDPEVNSTLKKDEEYVQYVTDTNCNVLWTNINGSLTPMLRAEGIKMTQNQLQVSFPKVLVEYHNTSGTMALAINVVPEGLDGVLKPFKAVFRLGEYDSWLGKNSPVVEHNNDNQLADNYDDLMHSLPENDLKSKTKDYYRRRGIRPLEAYEFSPVQINYTSVLAGETATKRTIGYDTRVEVTQPLLGGAEARDIQLLVKTDTRPDGILADRTKYNGLLSWPDKVSHSYYQVEHFIRKPLHFEVISDREDERFKKRIDVAINPWDLFATFGKDIRFDMTSKKLLEEYEAWERGDQKTPYKIPSRFNVDKFSYTAIKFDYTIDEDLSLEVKKTVLFKVDPEVQRYSSITDGRKIEWLRDGVWLMKVAIQKDYLDPSKKGSQIIRNCDGNPEYVVPGTVKHHTYVNEEGKRICEKLNLPPPEPAKDLTEEERNLLNASVTKVDERHFVTFQKRLVRVINGRINTPMTFSMRDLRLMRIRSNLVVQLEPIDETKLGVANWLTEQIDQKARIEERLRGDQIDFAFQSVKDVQDYLAKFLNGDDMIDEIEESREKLRKIDKQVLKIVDTSDAKTDKDKYNLAKGEIKAKRAYWEQRGNVIDAFLKNLDSDKIREAYASNNRDMLNAELSRVYEMGSGNPIQFFLKPQHMEMYEGYDISADIPSGSEPWTLPKSLKDTKETKVYGDTILRHFFPQSNNLPIDIGVLGAVQSEFKMDAQHMAERRLNDFTVESLGAAFSLDLLIEPPHVSGLEKRSFIGPVTFLLNANSSHIRPTDTLAEVFCINNSCAEGEPTDQQLKEWTWKGNESFMYKRFYNSVRHFFEKDVDDLIMCKLGGIMDDPKFCGPNMPYEIARDKSGHIVRNEKGEPKFQFLGYDEIRKRRIDIASLMPNFLEQNDLKFVSLGEESEALETFKYDDPTCNVLTSHEGFQGKASNRRNSTCFVPYTKSALPNLDGVREKKVYSYDEFFKSIENSSRRLVGAEDIYLKEWLYYYLGEQDGLKLPEFFPGEADLDLFFNEYVRPCEASRGGSDQCLEMTERYLRWTDLRSAVERPFLFASESAEMTDLRQGMLARVNKVFDSMVGARSQITREELLDFIHGDKIQGPLGSERFTMKMCSWMIEDLIGKFVANDFFVDDPVRVKRVAIELYEKCVSQGELSFDNPVLKIDEKLRIYKTDGYRFKGGKSMNINVSAKTGIDQKDSVGAGWSFNLNGLAGLVGYTAGKIAETESDIGKASAAAAVAGAELFKKVPAVGGALSGLGYGMKWDSGTGKSNGTDLNLGTYLVMQVATFDIQVESFERCVVLKFDTLALTKNKNFMDLIVDLNILPEASFPLTRTNEERAKAQANALDSGLMLCTGQVEQMLPNNPGNPSKWSRYIDQEFVEHSDEPKAIRERYYYFTQHFTEGDMLDSGDLYNHPWLLMLRGRRDFNIFMASLNAFAEDPRAYWNPLNDPNRMVNGSLREPLTMVHEYEWPIDNMIRTYLDIQPTFPGLYTALPNEPRDFPWGSVTPGSSFSPPMISGMGDSPLKLTSEIVSQYDVDVDPECQRNGGLAFCTEIELDDSSALRAKKIDGMFPPEIVRGDTK